MKKCLTKITAIALASLALLFVGCQQNAGTASTAETPNPEPKPQPTTKPDADADTIHSMILPHGTEAKIAAWDKASDAFATDLPDFETSFSDYKSIKIINAKGREVDYSTHELNGKTNRTEALKAAIKKAVEKKYFAGRKPKNVIIIFGDGMGESHIVASRKYYGDLIMDLLPYHAAVNHDSYKKPGEGELPAVTCTDSSAGGTAIVTGFKTRYGYIGLDANGTPVKNLAELAREKGMYVGNVTNDHMGDATPADVSIHSANRDYQDSIYGKLFLSSPDIAMGSDYGYDDYIQESKWGLDGRESIESLYEKQDGKVNGSGTDSQKYKDSSLKFWYNTNKDVLQQWAISMLNKYDGKSLTGTEYDFNNWYKDRNMHSYASFTDLVNAVQADYKIRGIANYEYHSDYKYDAKLKTAPAFGYKLGYGTINNTLPSYPEMVAATLSILDHKAKKNGDRGFYCLIENTVSDGWGHAGKPYDCMNEIQCFDEGLAIAIKYVLENPDTLLVVTADHETGAIEYRTGWDTNYKKVISTDTGHSKKPVPLLAFGAGADEFFPKSDLGEYVLKGSESWTADDWADYVKGGKGYDIQNRETGIFIARAMGYEKFGDLNGNGILDPDTESDSVVEVTR